MGDRLGIRSVVDFFYLEVRLKLSNAIRPGGLSEPLLLSDRLLLQVLHLLQLRLTYINKLYSSIGLATHSSETEQCHQRTGT